MLKQKPYVTVKRGNQVAVTKNKELHSVQRSPEDLSQETTSGINESKKQQNSQQQFIPIKSHKKIHSKINKTKQLLKQHLQESSQKGSCYKKKVYHNQQQQNQQQELNLHLNPICKILKHSGGFVRSKTCQQMKKQYSAKKQRHKRNQSISKFSTPSIRKKNHLSNHTVTGNNDGSRNNFSEQSTNFINSRGEFMVSGNLEKEDFTGASRNNHFSQTNQNDFGYKFSSQQKRQNANKHNRNQRMNQNMCQYMQQNNNYDPSALMKTQEEHEMEISVQEFQNEDCGTNEGQNSSNNHEEYPMEFSLNPYQNVRISRPGTDPQSAHKNLQSHQSSSKIRNQEYVFSNMNNQIMSDLKMTNRILEEKLMIKESEMQKLQKNFEEFKKQHQQHPQHTLEQQQKFLEEQEREKEFLNLFNNESQEKDSINSSEQKPTLRSPKFNEVESHGSLGSHRNDKHLIDRVRESQNKISSINEQESNDQPQSLLLSQWSPILPSEPHSNHANSNSHQQSYHHHQISPTPAPMTQTLKTFKRRELFSSDLSEKVSQEYESEELHRKPSFNINNPSNFHPQNHQYHLQSGKEKPSLKNSAYLTMTKKDQASELQKTVHKRTLSSPKKEVKDKDKYTNTNDSHMNPQIDNNQYREELNFSEEDEEQSINQNIYRPITMTKKPSPYTESSHQSPHHQHNEQPSAQSITQNPTLSNYYQEPISPITSETTVGQQQNLLLNYELTPLKEQQTESKKSLSIEESQSRRNSESSNNQSYNNMAPQSQSLNSSRQKKQSQMVNSVLKATIKKNNSIIDQLNFVDVNESQSTDSKNIADTAYPYTTLTSRTEGNSDSTKHLESFQQKQSSFSSVKAGANRTIVTGFSNYDTVKQTPENDKPLYDSITKGKVTFHYGQSTLKNIKKARDSHQFKTLNKFVGTAYEQQDEQMREKNSQTELNHKEQIKK